MKNQWLMFGLSAVHGLLNMITRSDLDHGVRKNQKFQKNGDAKGTPKATVPLPFHKRVDLPCLMGGGLMQRIFGNEY